MIIAAVRFLACGFGFAVAVAGAGLDREIVLAPHSGATVEDVEIRRWQDAVRDGSNPADAHAGLARAFLAKARRTQDAGYYKLVEKTADAMVAASGNSDEALRLRGVALHNLHRFAEAEGIARRLGREPEDFGLLSDALMEQGKIDEAVEALQRMMNLRPGAEALARASHLRWLKGDLAGATRAMEDAWRAAAAGPAESRAWILTRLSGLYLRAGNVEPARAAAGRAIALVADYAPALFARGQAEFAAGSTEDAVRHLRAAIAANPLPEYRWWLADALRANGQPEEALQVELALEKRGAGEDPRTLAVFLATKGERPAVALRLARAELAQRADVFTHDAMAWALHAAGEFAAADAQMQEALRSGTKDARLLFHAGEIALTHGRHEAARVHFEAAAAIGGSLTPSERMRLNGRLEAASVQSGS